MNCFYFYLVSILLIWTFVSVSIHFAQNCSKSPPWINSMLFFRFPFKTQISISKTFKIKNIPQTTKSVFEEQEREKHEHEHIYWLLSLSKCFAWNDFHCALFFALWTGAKGSITNRIYRIIVVWNSLLSSDWIFRESFVVGTHNDNTQEIIVSREWRGKIESNRTALSRLEIIFFFVHFFFSRRP